MKSICTKLSIGVALAVLTLTGMSWAQTPGPEQCEFCEARSCFDRLGYVDALKEIGIQPTLSFLGFYQANVHGGLATDKHEDRWLWNYTIEVTFDPSKLIPAWKDAEFFLELKGASGDGINPDSVGSAFNVNDKAGGNHPIYVGELSYRQGLFDNRLQMRIGRLDLTSGFLCGNCPVAFDTNRYATSGTSQFLNAAFVNNPTIPFPSVGLGVAGMVEVIPTVYVSAGVQDADAGKTTTGFDTAFDGYDNLFYIAEGGVTPTFPSAMGNLSGAYRVGYWLDDHVLPKLDGSGVQGHDDGLYVSCDQMVLKESASDDCSQGLGLFFRWGRNFHDVSDVQSFWSVGAQYKGLVPSRDHDVLGLAWGRGEYNSESAATASDEDVLELYYRLRVTPWFAVTPDVQFVRNPGGDDSVRDAVVVGLRAHILF